MVARFSPPELPLEEEDKNIQKVIMISRGAFSSFKNNKNKGFFYKHTIKVCISCFRLYPGTSALEQHTWQWSWFYVLLEATHKSNRRAPCQLKELFELTWLPSRAQDGNEAVTVRNRREKSLTFIFSKSASIRFFSQSLSQNFELIFWWWIMLHLQKQMLELFSRGIRIWSSQKSDWHLQIFSA